MSKPIIPDEKEFSIKIDQIKKGGLDSLHVVTDFDRTLTYAHVPYDEGEDINNSYGILESSPLVPEEYLRRAQALTNHYYPIEKSNIPLEEKIEYMKEWWAKSAELMIEYGIDSQLLQSVVQHRNMVYRNGVSDFLASLDSQDIPCLIFSAGLGDVIKLSLEEEEIMYDNMHIVGNLLKFDSDGKILGYDGEIIMAHNKTEKFVQGKPIEEEIIGRDNVILMGDVLDDCQMVNGDNKGCVLRIGFYNKPTSKNASQNGLKDYMKCYDAIITNDGCFNYINEVFSTLTKK